MITKKQKIKFIKIAEEKGVENASKHYYKYYYKRQGPKKKYPLAAKNIRRKIRGWIKIYNSGNMNELKCKAGKNKKEKMVPIKEVWDSLTEKERFILFEDFLKEKREKSKKERMKKQDDFSKVLSKNKRAEIFGLSREGIRVFVNRGKVYLKKSKNDYISNAINDIAFEHSEVVNGKTYFKRGRKYICNEISERYNISLTDRAVGYRMTSSGVSSNVRATGKSKKYKEGKNTKIKIENHLNRNFERDMTIALDVKVIPLKDSNTGYAHLEPIIDLRSTFIETWDLSPHQGIEQTMRNLTRIDLTKIDMAASDHGSQYTSHTVQDYYKANGVLQSCSRVANSLDNRPSEFWFGILQSECLNFHDYKSYSFEKLKQVIGNFIIYYNTKRKQEKLGWLTPEEFKKQNPSLCANF